MALVLEPHYNLSKVLPRVRAQQGGASGDLMGGENSDQAGARLKE